MKQENKKFNCIIERCTYDSPDYKVYSAYVDKKQYPEIKHNEKYGNVTIFGNLHHLCETQSYEVTAVEELNKYGYGYKVINIRMDQPKSEEDVYVFLQEILTFNQASELWKHYPDIIDRVITGNTDDIDLNKLKGIKEATFLKIKDKIIQNYALYDLVVEFGGILTISMLKKIYDEYPSIEMLKRKLREDPYKCLTRISGVGFIKADAILLELERTNKIKFPFDLKSSQQRCAACIEYFLIENQNNGNTKMDLRDLRKQVVKLVPTCSQHYVECLKNDYFYYNKETYDIALRKTYDTENYIAERIADANTYKRVWNIDYTKYRNVGDCSLSDEQVSALKCICENNIMILNGNAGSGKSMTSSAIIKMLDDNHKTFRLFAPTGRAAKVLSDYTQCPASTIHRGLGYRPPSDWGYNKECKLDCDVLIIDEFSMTDIFLFAHVIDALDFKKTKLIIIGDSAQLPSVGPGNLLHDFMNSNIIPTISLSKIFRYADGGLMKVATDVRNMKPYLNGIKEKCTVFGNAKDYSFIQSANERIVNDTVSLYRKLIKNHKPEDILVLSAYNKGEYGTIVLNKHLQKLANPNISKSSISMQIGETTFYKDDIVIQTVNNYKAIVYIDNQFTYGDDAETTFIPNGMIGKIKLISLQFAVIDYDGIEVIYKKSDMQSVMLGYAISIHKSQGGSADTVVLLTPSSHSYMLNSNLIYVGLTRMKKNLYHLGDSNAINRSVKKKENLARNTFMCHFLKKNYSLLENT
jgi:exodeoxyribonuclease V alpha subunit